MTLALTLAALAGCHSSQDAQSWTSTRTQPKSVALEKMPSGNTIWSIDLPVNHRLDTVVWRNGDDTSTLKKVFVPATGPATSMEWEVYDLSSDASDPVRSGTLELEGQPIKWSWSIRDKPAGSVEPIVEARPAEPADGTEPPQPEAETMPEADAGADPAATQPGQ
jgi:hypothetical protein